MGSFAADHLVLDEPAFVATIRGGDRRRAARGG